MKCATTIKIKNLRLRTIIGLYPHERENRQDVIINASIHFDASRAANSDRVEETIDYKTLNKKIIDAVEKSQFFLLEKLAHHILELVMEDPVVQEATIEVDKPQALRFADSVSCVVRAERPL